MASLIYPHMVAQKSQSRGRNNTKNKPRNQGQQSDGLRAIPTGPRGTLEGTISPGQLQCTSQNNTLSAFRSYLANCCMAGQGLGLGVR